MFGPPSLPIGRTDQGVGRGVVTGCTTVVDLVVRRIGEAGRRIDVTDQAGGFAGHEARR